MTALNVVVSCDGQTDRQMDRLTDQVTKRAVPNPHVELWNSMEWESSLKAMYLNISDFILSGTRVEHVLC